MMIFLVNPTASSGNGRKVWDRLKVMLDEKGCDYRVIMLTHPGHAQELAAALSRKGREVTVVIVGGDGTVNDFLQGLEERSHMRLGVIPVGSGNDLVRGLSLPSEPEKCLEKILSCTQTRPLNIGTAAPGPAGDRPENSIAFGVSSGFGYDALVCHRVANSRGKSIFNRFGLGKLVYLFTALKLLLTIRPARMQITLDEEKSVTFDRVFFAAAMNTRFEGGGFKFCPEADAGDGYLDVIVAEGFSRIGILAALPLALAGKHTKKRGIHIYRCRRAQIVSDKEACLHTDGEARGFHTQVTWSLQDESLQVLS